MSNALDKQFHQDSLLFPLLISRLLPPELQRAQTKRDFAHCRMKMNPSHLKSRQWGDCGLFCNPGGKYYAQRTGFVLKPLAQKTFKMKEKTPLIKY